MTTKQQITDRISELVNGLDVPNELRDAIAYACNGGKLIRPILLYECARELGVCDADTLDFACAIEFLHTASLIHDDLPCIDNDELRRGRASVHRQFGEGLAVIIGDALLDLGYRTMIDSTVTSNELDALKVISQHSGLEGMLAGQYIDVMNTGVRLDLFEHENMVDRKTAGLFKAAIGGAARLAGVSDEKFNKLIDEAKALGCAFQIADDLIDEGFGKISAGKSLGKDKAAFKNTYVSIFGIDKSKQLLNDNLQKISCETLRAIANVKELIEDSVIL